MAAQAVLGGTGWAWPGRTLRRRGWPQFFRFSEPLDAGVRAAARASGSEAHPQRLESVGGCPRCMQSTPSRRGWAPVAACLVSSRPGWSRPIWWWPSWWWLTPLPSPCLARKLW